ncbi:NAD(P)-dependent oxidoreductase [Spirosoma oryzicola]|uniref:NAD(P)-dependent oxidoreductase n=1 Tax=Spirosoma oryzicola TaxID=2898794 RepID=UPI001E412E0E|nr:NAD(P)-dependent oxidoreductase [Spirosoma oryzicola]UHG92748.1 NAD(P)-dependent oxidoreductase [Spirosoma oryzicola]
MNIAFIGLGQMGQAIAHNLLKGDHTLTVFNRSRDKAESLLQAGASWADTPAEAVAEADVVFTMVSDDAALRNITLGDFGFLTALPEGGIHVSCSTISPETARELAEQHRQKNTEYVACPVFGKPEAAQAAKLWICTSGSQSAKDQVGPLLELIGQGTYDFGDDVGAANVVKLAGNFMIGCAIEAMAEAFTLGEKNGVDRKAMWELFSNTLFASPVYKNYGKMIAEEAYQPVGASPALIRKDIRLVLDTAQQSMVPMPFGMVVFQQLTATVAKGIDNIDWAGFAGEVSENAGVGKR